jgi:hypothetical protein
MVFGELSGEFADDDTAADLAVIALRDPVGLIVPSGQCTAALRGLLRGRGSTLPVSPSNGHARENPESFYCYSRPELLLPWTHFINKLCYQHKRFS